MRLLNVNCLKWNTSPFFSSKTMIVFFTSQAYFLKWQFYGISQFEYQLKIQDKVVSRLSCFCSKYELCTWTIYCCFLTDSRVYPWTQKKSLKSLFNLIVPCHQLPAYAYTEYEAFPSERIKKHFINTRNLYSRFRESAPAPASVFKGQKRTSWNFQVSRGKE